MWHPPKRKDKDKPSDLTVGQRFDLVDTALEVISRGAGGTINPLNWMTGTMAAADITFSSATSKRGNIAGAGASAAVAQVAGMGGFVAGTLTGTAIGSFLLPVIGSYVGGVIGGGIGSLTSDKIARTATQHLFNAVKDTRPRVNFGEFRDSQPAYTMRAKAEQQLQGSLLNARQYLGKEAQLFHH